MQSKIVAKYLAAFFISSLLLTQPASGQLFNLSKVLDGKIDPVYLQDPMLHAINNDGTILGSLASVTDPGSRRLFVLREKSDTYTVKLLDEYPSCEPIDISDDEIIVFNALLPDAQFMQAYRINAKSGGRPILIYAGNDQPTTVTQIHENEVAVNIDFENLPDRSTSEANSHRANLGPAKVSTAATKGLIVDISSKDITEGGFSIARWYNLNSTVTDFNESGHFCGQSQGYSAGENIENLYPYLATRDSVYRLLDGYRGTAIAMNDQDQVVGTWQHPLTRQEYGFYYDSALLATSEHAWRDMLEAIPTTINRDGIVVGQHLDTAFVMIDREYVAKTEVIPDLPTSWRRTEIVDLNDRLDIIGYAIFGRQRILYKTRLSVPD